MPRRPSAGSIHNERGSILIITAAACLIFTFLFMGIAEFGRWLLAKEQAQTSADAAALASSVSGIRSIVTLGITGYYIRPYVVTIIDEETGNEYTETRYKTVYRTFSKTGYERSLIDQEGWKDVCYSRGYVPYDYKIADRYVEYNVNTSEKAASIFLAENPTQGNSEIKSVKVHGDKNDPYYPSVVVSVVTKLKTMFPNSGLFSGEYNIETVSQGDTFFKDPTTGKWSKAPPDATAEGLF
jgi:hypothetical protein